MNRLLLNNSSATVQHNTINVLSCHASSALVTTATATRAQSMTPYTVRFFQRAAAAFGSTIPFETKRKNESSDVSSRRSCTSSTGRVCKLSTTAKVALHSSGGPSMYCTPATADYNLGMASGESTKFLQLKNINQNFIAMEYAVRGPIVVRASEIEKELNQGAKKPFDYVIRANIGDCHAMGQKPITFLRQLLSLCFEPDLIERGNYPDDVKKRAKLILDCCQGSSVGSYTDSGGLEVVRRQVADFITKRDGIPSQWEDIYITGGASPAIKMVLSLINSADSSGKPPGVMVSIPQYPLYSATLAEYGMVKIDYFLDEEHGWSLSTEELQRAYDSAKGLCVPKALVVINPGNPTGQVLKRDNIEEIIKFAYKYKMLLMADEVYQDNVYDKDSKFFSFKKVLMEMGPPYSEMELASFMSASKGYLGECGIRGGYMEIVNMCPKVKAMLSKAITASLCSTTAGQVAISALVNPPQPGEPSHNLYMKQRNEVLDALKVRAELVYNTLSSFEGYKVNPVQGAMYVFPRIEIPPKAITAAKAKNMIPDVFYAHELLEATGICIVPGSGFGQKPKTWHFRSTILPQTSVLKDMMNKFKKFHADFMQKYK